MPLVYQQNINDATKIAVWHITEPEDFFLKQVSAQREITHPHKRLQHLAGRFLLKVLYPDFPNELICIADTRKPFLENEAYHFSISHCGNYAAVIVSLKQRVGVDIEWMDRKIENVKHKFLSITEQEALGSQNLINNTWFLILGWSVKEAVYKWYGDGEVDFKEHIHIEDIFVNGKEGIVYCNFLKNAALKLEVNFIFFEDNCLAWLSGNFN